MLLSVDFRERSNMNSIATASLHTRGNMLTNSRCPPRSQIENTICVFRMETHFSMKLWWKAGMIRRALVERPFRHFASRDYMLTSRQESEYNPHRKSLRSTEPSSSSCQSAEYMSVSARASNVIFVHRLTCASPTMPTCNEAVNIEKYQ
jgi:hypothetical protein